MPNIALLESALQAIAVQSTPNSPSTTGTDYNAFLCNALPPTIPSNETVTDEAMVGDGFSRTRRNTYNYYWNERGLGISGELNDHISAILMKGFLAGATTVTPLTPVSNKDNSTVQASSSVVPKLFSIYRHLQGEQFIHGNLFPNGFTIAQEGEARPTFNFDLMGSGLFLDDVALAAATFDESAIIPAPNYEYFHGAATIFTATDGTDTYDFTAQGRLISLSIEGGNGGRIARRPGDTFLTAGDRNSGAFARSIAMGKATASIRVRVDLASDLKEFKALVQRKTLTGTTIKFVGFDKIGGGTNDYEFEIQAPRARFGLIEGDTDDAYGAISLEIAPERDTVTKGYYISRVRTDKTLIG